MNKFLLFYICFLLASCTACKEKPIEPFQYKTEMDSLYNRNGILMQIPYKWRTPISDEYYKRGYIEQPTYYNNAALSCLTFDGKIHYAMLDATNGKKQWMSFLSGPYIYYENALLSFSPFYHDNETVIYSYDDVMYNLDLRTGTHLWEITHPEVRSWASFYPRITGIDSVFFIAACQASIPHRVANAMFRGNKVTGELEKLFIVEQFDSIYSEAIDITLAFPAKINDTVYLMCGYEFQGDGRMGLFNTETKTWVYKDIDTPGHGFMASHYVEGDKCYVSMAGATMLQMDIMTGEILWENLLDSFISNVVIVGDYIMCAQPEFCSDPELCPESGRYAAVNKHTGETVWVRTDISSVSVNYYLQELNGVVYHTNGLLVAVDAETGEIFWELKPNDGGRFSDYTVVPGVNGKKGRVIARSERYAYCYEAVR